MLELKDQLALRPEQERATRDLFTSMQRAARTVGDQLLDLEVQLDASFASGRATTAEVARLTAEIAAAEGRLRAVHLSTHLDQKVILTADQVARYDQLRGYSGHVPVVATQHGQGVSHGGR
ncbi:MAG TPA: hypothetical protein VNM48_18130 [Chloroflexota bacterium]|nr:hypothetical protein [Chloroflexota bacterium]